MKGKINIATQQQELLQIVSIVRKIGSAAILACLRYSKKMVN